MDLLPAEIAKVLNHFRRWGPFRSAEELVSHAGLSGARLWKVTTGEGHLWVGAADSAHPLVTEGSRPQFCLRQWPTEHPSEARLRDMHRWLLTAARELPCIAAPMMTDEGCSFVEHAGYFWELQPWAAGAPWRGESFEQPQRQTVAMLQALAQFHRWVGEPGDRRLAAAPAVLERRDRVAELLAGGWERIERAVLQCPLPLAAEQIAQLQLLAKCVGERWPALEMPLHRASQVAVQLKPVVRDLQPDHFLFTGDALTGWIDFGAMRIDTPAVDLARWLESFVDSPTDEVSRATEIYNATGPAPIDGTLVRLLLQCNLLLGPTYWLEWLLVEHREFASLEQVFERLRRYQRRILRFFPLAM